MSHNDVQSTSPRLAASADRLYLAWVNTAERDDGILPSQSTLNVRQWDGTAFVEELPGDAVAGGVHLADGMLASLSLAVDPAGHPVAAWQDATSGNPEIYVRANLFNLGAVYYVNDANLERDRFTSATGESAHDGRTPATPKRSVQDVLDTYTLVAGDVILVDAGTYEGFTVSGTDAGFLIQGAWRHEAVVTGAVRFEGAQGVTLAQLNLQGGVTLAADSRSTLVANVISNVTVDGANSALLELNHVAQSLALEGDAVCVEVRHNELGSVHIAGTADFFLRHNTIRDGVVLAAETGGRLLSNDITAAGTALEIAAPFTGLIADNDIHGAAVGVEYAAAARLNGNRIFGNTTGVRATVDGDVNALGFVPDTAPNEIYGNTTGVHLTGRMQNQHVHHNLLGVTGSGLLGPDDLQQANVIASNDVGVDFDGLVQFNRIARNQTGIRAHGGQEISHNLLYENSLAGVHVTGVSDVRIISNTIYAAAGANVQVDGASSLVEIRNNLLWTAAGYDIYVSNDSQDGFFSDYNDLHAGPDGTLVHWIFDFTDLLDWQADVARFDLHSTGRTAVHPRWSTPAFVNQAVADFRMFGVSAEQRFSSPSIDAGDPASDLALPAGYQNLLVNPGFESGLSGWVVNDRATTRSTTPAPFLGNAYFFAGSDTSGFAEQTVNLAAAGFTPAQLDGQDYVVVFSGRVRAAIETKADRGEIRLTFLDQSGNPIGVRDAFDVPIDTVVVPATNTQDRWELIGDRLPIPVGTRSIRYRFYATRVTGSDTDSYLDHAQLYVLPESVAPDLGAYGNTPLDDAASSVPRIALRFPDLYVDWEREKPRIIQWDTVGNQQDLPVRIDLYQDGPHGPAFRLNIVEATSDDGQFAWTPVNHGVDFGTYGLRIGVSLVGDPIVFDRSTESFTVPENTATFYVNDRDTGNDEYTTKPGDNRYTGKLPSAPKPYPLNVLRIYSLGSGDTLYTDTGQYASLAPIVISNAAGVGDDEGFRWTGPTGPNRSAELWHAHPDTVAPLIELNDADYVTISRLTLNNEEQGLWAHQDSTNLTLTYLTVADHTADGIRLDDTSTALELGHITATNNRGYGIYANSTVAHVHDNTISGNRNSGLYFVSPGTTRIEDNAVYNNSQYGMYLGTIQQGSVFGNTVYGNYAGIMAWGQTSAAPTEVTGNRVYNNATSGIQASGDIRVDGNAVFGHAGTYAYGISLSGGAEASGNVVHSNETAILLGSYSDVAANNRVYNNRLGINGNNGAVRGNQVYSNVIGIQGGRSVENNLVYANSELGILAAGSAQLTNNTVYQPQGDAVQVTSSNTNLRNNILWTEAGHDIYVGPYGEPGFTSDYNLLYTTGAGRVGYWAGASRPTLAAWQNAAFTDQNSLAQDPLFADPDGPDDQLGFVETASQGFDDDFHVMSTYGRLTGGLTPVLDPATGLPVYPAVTETVDAVHSPAIDRGDDASAYHAEPSPNGGFVNLGAYGNTSQASKSPEEYVLVTRPDGGESWPSGRTHVVRWRTQDWLGTVDIELLQDDQVVHFIAAGVANSGQFPWTIPGPETIASGNDYRIRVTRGGGSLWDLSNAPFTIMPPINTYYVNVPDDISLSDNEYTTASGDDANDGLLPSTPKASLRALLEAYDLGFGDTILVDTGTYTLTTNIFLTSADAGVTIRGPVGAGHAAVLNRGNTSSSSYVFELQNADDVTLEHLQMTGGYYAVYADYQSDSDRVTIRHNEVFGNEYSGIYLRWSNDESVIVDNRIHDNGRMGSFWKVHRRRSRGTRCLPTQQAST